jgi:hypothetical protein
MSETHPAGDGGGSVNFRFVKKNAWSAIGHNAWRMFTAMFLFALLLYVVIASTMTRFAPTNFGPTLMTSPKFEGGIAPVGDEVYVAPGQKFDHSFLENLRVSFVPTSGVFKVKLVEGPAGQPDWEKYGFSDVDAKQKLNSQYIAKCLEGCKTEGRFILIDSGAIMGIPAEVK